MSVTDAAWIPRGCGCGGGRQLWLQLDLWPGNLPRPQVHPKKQKKKRERESEKAKIKINVSGQIMFEWLTLHNFSFQELLVRDKPRHPGDTALSLDSHLSASPTCRGASEP